MFLGGGAPSDRNILTKKIVLAESYPYRNTPPYRYKLFGTAPMFVGGGSPSVRNDLDTNKALTVPLLLKHALLLTPHDLSSF